MSDNQKEDNSFIIKNKFYDEESVFMPEYLLREARRQKNIINSPIPKVCILDPDGDIVKYLINNSKARLNEYWACYHTNLFDFHYAENNYGIIGCAVGSSFSVLVAEELFSSGCELLISLTSAGKICYSKENSRFIIIEKSLRDEGTSYHYLAPSDYSHINKELLEKLKKYFYKSQIQIDFGSSWTTDAPFRETENSILNAKARGILTVEMESSALYAFAHKKNKKVVCLAHLTNSMGINGDDFEKGIENGSIESLEIIHHVYKAVIEKFID